MGKAFFSAGVRGTLHIVPVKGLFEYPLCRSLEGFSEYGEIAGAPRNEVELLANCHIPLLTISLVRAPLAHPPYEFSSFFDWSYVFVPVSE
jgi:hypothetical protein